MFKNSTDKEEKNDGFEYTFFFYTVSAIYLIYYLLGKFEFHHSNESKLIAVFSGFSEIENEKHLITSCITLLLGINLCAFVFANSDHQKKTLTTVSLYVFSTQLSIWFIFGLTSIILDYSGLLSDDPGFFASLLLLTITLLFLGFIIFCIFILPYNAIKNALTFGLIDQITASKLRWFIFIPLLITIVIRLFIPWKEMKEDFVLNFINSKDKNIALIKIDSANTDNFNINLKFLLKKHTEEDKYIQPSTAFFIHYLIYEDQNNDKKIQTWEVKYNDTINLSTNQSENILIIKNNEPMLFQLSGNLSRKKCEELIYVLKNSVGHSVDLNMRTLEDSVITLYDRKSEVQINNKTINIEQ